MISLRSQEPFSLCVSFKKKLRECVGFSSTLWYHSCVGSSDLRPELSIFSMEQSIFGWAGEVCSWLEFKALLARLCMLPICNSAVAQSKTNLMTMTNPRRRWNLSRWPAESKTSRSIKTSTEVGLLRIQSNKSIFHDSVRIHTSTKGEMHNADTGHVLITTRQQK